MDKCEWRKGQKINERKTGMKEGTEFGEKRSENRTEGCKQIKEDKKNINKKKSIL